MLRHGDRIGIQKEQRRLEKNHENCLVGNCTPVKLDRSKLHNSEICYIVQRMHGFTDCMNDGTDAINFTRKVMKRSNDVDFATWVREEMKTHPMEDLYPEWALKWMS